MSVWTVGRICHCQCYVISEAVVAFHEFGKKMQTEEKINAKLWPLHIKWPTATRKMSRILYYGQHEMLFFLESIHFIKKYTDNGSHFSSSCSFCYITSSSQHYICTSFEQPCLIRFRK